MFGLSVDIFTFIDLVMLSMLLAVGLAVVRLTKLFATVMLFGVYSLLSAVWFVSLDAVDVAFTEAAVGAGISTVLMLGAMLLTSRRAEKVPPARHWVALIVMLAAGAALFYATLDMPGFGDPNSPANAYVGLMYTQKTGPDMELPNVVTAVLASYRGYDTFGETTVILTAGLGVMLLLGTGISGQQQERSKNERQKGLFGGTLHALDNHHLVLSVVSKSMIPIIMLFGFYVHWHGDFSAGGGFQAGVILASTVILYALIFGMDEARRAVPPRAAQIGAALGVMIYGGTGIATVLMGGKFLDYAVFNSHHPSHGQHIGILAVELGVLVTVASVMLSIFYGFAGRYREISDKEW